MSIEALKQLAKSLGVRIGYADIPFGLFLPHVEGVQVILLPKGQTIDQERVTLAHELGHATLGHRVGLKPRIIQEIEAWHWAKCALAGRL